MALYLEKDLKFIFGSDQQRYFDLCVIVKYWKDGYLKIEGKL